MRWPHWSRQNPQQFFARLVPSWIQLPTLNKIFEYQCPPQNMDFPRTVFGDGEIMANGLRQDPLSDGCRHFLSSRLFIKSSKRPVKRCSMDWIQHPCRNG